MFIRTERLFLRPGWPEDWHEVLERIADDGVVMNLANAPWPYTAADAKAFLDLPREHLLPKFLITLPCADGKLVGAAGLAREGGEVELGYWIAREHWGQGYATEAVRHMLGLARTLGHRRVVAYHFEDNPASGRVLVKAGFTPTGAKSQRHSAGRGGTAKAVHYAAELQTPNDCDVDRMNLAAA